MTDEPVLPETEMRESLIRLDGPDAPPVPIEIEVPVDATTEELAVVLAAAAGDREAWWVDEPEGAPDA
jgi:hypothetical protein